MLKRDSHFDGWSCVIKCDIRVKETTYCSCLACFQCAVWVTAPVNREGNNLKNWHSLSQTYSFINVTNQEWMIIIWWLSIHRERENEISTTKKSFDGEIIYCTRTGQENDRRASERAHIHTSTNTVSLHKLAFCWMHLSWSMIQQKTDVARMQLTIKYLHRKRIFQVDANGQYSCKIYIYAGLTTTTSC